MAEFALTKLAESILSQTVERIAELLIQEAASLRNIVRDDVVLLQDELQSLQGFIESADTKQHHDKHFQCLVLKVKDVASDAEDVIETYIFKVASSYIKDLHNKRVRAQISFVRERIKVIFTSMQTYWIASVAAGEVGTSGSTVELQRKLRKSSPNEEDEDVIILEDSSRDLTAALTKEEDQRRIVSVVGMGGLGKTTLAKKVFKSVKQRFDSAAWVFLSQRFVPINVLIGIFIQVDSSKTRDDLRQKDEQEIIELLQKELKEKRYLVVLDDIWTIKDWASIKSAFPQGKKGSKLLFTTRNREVAAPADSLSSSIELRDLKPEECEELLRKKAFRGGVCPPQFEQLVKKMAEKCSGLPLAVVILGGLLSTRSSLDEWNRVLEDVNSYLNKVQSHQQYEGVNEILALSYYDLPYYLKPCFLYLGNFPEDSEIRKRKVVQLWIGEGLIPRLKPTTRTGEKPKQTLEAVAEGYLEELIHRCMVQVDKRDHTGIVVKTCRMHDLMRDLCISKAREESFAQIIQQQNESNLSTDVSSASSFEHLDGNPSRRLVIHPDVDLCFKKPWACSIFFRKVLVCNNNPSSSSSSSLVESKWVEQQVHPNLRSLLCLGGILSLSTLKSSNFRMLRVLKLRFSSGSKIPRGIGNLIYLRYLCLWADYDEGISLPSSIGNLRNLQTLDLRNNESLRGSVGMISKLIRLRHLLLPYHLRKQKSFRIDKLKDIETLKNIPGSVLIRSYDALHKLTNLRNISMDFDGEDGDVEDDVRRVLGSQIVKSGRLTSLQMGIQGNNEAGFPSLESLSSCHSLSKLLLEGKMMKLQQQGLIHLPQSLTKLALSWSELEQDPMPMLENKLPNLRFLSLCNNAYVGSRMVCSAHGFPNLHTLELYALEYLREWIVEKGAMPSLKKLTIRMLSELEMIPEGLEFVTSLKELEIKLMGNSFCEKLQVKNGIEGEDYYKVRHIPSISFG